MYCSEEHITQNNNLRYATVAQLVEYDLAKVGVAGSNPVCRSLREAFQRMESFFFCIATVQSLSLFQALAVIYQHWSFAMANLRKRAEREGKRKKLQGENTWKR